MKYTIILLFFIIYCYFKKINFEKFENNNLTLTEKYIEIKYPLKYKILDNFIDKKDIKYIINKCKDYLQKSTIVNDNNDISNWRTSKTTFINYILGYNDPILKKIINKVTKMLNISPEYIEEINLTYYNKGNQYKQHHDYFNPKLSNSEKEILKKSGQRMKTIFVYLKNAIEGGETYFPIEKKKFKLNEGDAIIWENAYIKNNICYMNYNSLHEGLPPIKGEKYGLNIWIKEKKN
jgi:prolyl 4-hydroxylase